MKAVVFRAPKNVRVEEREEPTLQHPRDAILRVTTTAICGSDLHIYNGLVPQLRPMVLGHEFMGVVEQVGDQVTNLQPGDRVVVPFPIADGTCFFCRHGLPTQCETSNPNYGPHGGLVKEKGAALFGYTDLYGGYDGGQAEKVRVPFADYGPRKVPDGLTDEQVILLTDVAATGWTAIDWAQPKPDELVAVFGGGPVGLAALKSARHAGARVVVIEPEAYRREAAKRMGAAVIDPNEQETAEAIRELTEGRGADVCVDAVGMEPQRNLIEKVGALIHLQRGSMKVLSACFDAARRGARISVVGVYATPFDNFPIHQVFDKELRVFTGQAPVHEHIDRLMELVQTGQMRFDDIISHRFPLEEAPYAYGIFNGKEEACVKVVLKP